MRKILKIIIIIVLAEILIFTAAYGPNKLITYLEKEYYKIKGGLVERKIIISNAWGMQKDLNTAIETKCLKEMPPDCSFVWAKNNGIVSNSATWDSGYYDINCYFNCSK